MYYLQYSGPEISDNIIVNLLLLNCIHRLFFDDGVSKFINHGLFQVKEHFLFAKF